MTLLFTTQNTQRIISKPLTGVTKLNIARVASPQVLEATLLLPGVQHLVLDSWWAPCTVIKHTEKFVKIDKIFKIVNVRLKT